MSSKKGIFKASWKYPPDTSTEEESSCRRKGIGTVAEESLICSKEEFLEHYERHLPATAATEEESLSNMKSFL